MRFKRFLSIIALGLNLLALNGAAAAEPTDAPRIITLSPHMTEMVYDLGLEEQLVARDDASNYPKEVKNIPSIGSGLNPNKELLLLYQPDILLHFTSNIQLDNLFPAKKIDVMASLPDTVPALFDDWRMVLARVQHDEKKLAATEAKINVVEAEWQSLVEVYKTKAPKKVFFLISEQPVFSLSDMTFLAQAVKGCHTENIFANIKQPSFIVNPEELLLHTPDIVIHGYSATDPNGKERAQQSALTLFDSIGIKLRTEQLVTVDVDILHRPTLRFIKELPKVCEAIHRG
ncbi:MAG: ABC transporter substrate-binding protein [Alcaligenaceae bacterium]|jgi:ABC-type Fe3+-hydroxamate transport system substrate-binding protein|nr:ABC transporter substrate-binding protein [Alcaligenaceae bacterium]